MNRFVDYAATTSRMSDALQSVVASSSAELFADTRAASRTRSRTAASAARPARSGTDPAMARFVLVHGAFHGAWCWEPLVAELSSAGHAVVTLDLPGSGDDTTPIADVTLDAYARRICDRLAEQPEPVVLVGHSMGGVAITQAAARCPDRIARLVYVAAFLPGDGQSLVDLAQLPEGADDMVQANMVVEGEPPVATMPAEAAREAFYGLCAPEQVAWATEQIRPQPVVPFITPVSLDGSEATRPPRAYIISAQDRAIPTALQRRLVADNPDLDVVELDADHSPFLSRTGELAAALDRLAERP
jgi:pimeloyl-ACP methyl ester carboxylesterase